jgi:hypothetical protein
MLEHLPVTSRVGKSLVGGIDLNKTRMQHVVEALIALSPSPNGFTASEVAARVRALSNQSSLLYGPRHEAYNLKKLRGKQIVRRIGHTRRYEPLPTGLRVMTALLALRNKAIKPLLAAARPLHPARGDTTQNRSTRTTTPSKLQWPASFMNLALLLDHRQFFGRPRPEAPIALQRMQVLPIGSGLWGTAKARSRSANPPTLCSENSIWRKNRKADGPEFQASPDPVSQFNPQTARR